MQLGKKVKFSFTPLALSFSSDNLVIEAQKLPWQIQQPSTIELRGENSCFILICLVKSQQHPRKLIIPQVVKKWGQRN